MVCADARVLASAYASTFSLDLIVCSNGIVT